MEQTAITPARRADLEAVHAALLGGERFVLTTHVNADGDGAGSEIALASWLAGLGRAVSVVNPTPFPRMFRFLVDDPGLLADAGSAAADRALAAADTLVVLDTADPGRIGRLARAADRLNVVIIDHHVGADRDLEGVKVQDATACATGELLHDLLTLAGMPRPWPRAVREAIYTAIVTDTGSFRFANTTPRAHALAGDLIAQGVDPEVMYRRIFATVPLYRFELLRHALDRLEVDAEAPITSITVERDIMKRLDAGSDDLDGLVEHARSVEGTEVAILFRETADGATKISLRSAGETNVNAIARQFGGGGHVKASGALIPEPLDIVKPRVIQAVRDALRHDRETLSDPSQA